MRGGKGGPPGTKGALAPKHARTSGCMFTLSAFLAMVVRTDTVRATLSGSCQWMPLDDRPLWSCQLKRGWGG